jgi:hypothetical protein
MIYSNPNSLSDAHLMVNNANMVSPFDSGISLINGQWH